MREEKRAAPSPPDAVLIVMAKAPRPGEVKTRLVPPLTPEAAASLHRCCLQDTLEKASRLPGVSWALAYTPAGARIAFRDLRSGDSLGFPQKGRDLGERMLQCFLRGFAEGFAFVGLYGTDVPHARSGEILRGFDLLRRGSADLVLGPAEDGGYYFIAARAAHPELFRGVRWSAPEVLQATLARAAALGLRTAEVARERDLDTPEDLKALGAFLSRAPASVAPKTRRFLFEDLKGFF